MRNLYVLPAVVLILAISCTKDEDETEKTGPVVFTRAPVDTSCIKYTTPLGNINAPGHTFPTNHIYFYMKGTAPVEVYSIGSGKVTRIQYHDGSDDNNIQIEYSNTCKYYYDHVSNVPEDIAVGLQISPGMLIGYSNPMVAALDLGVIDYEVTRSFIEPDRYLEHFLNCGDPYLYFTDSVRNVLYEKNPRIDEPRGGKIDFDIDGRLSGNWFLKGTPIHILNATHEYMESQLCFVYDMWDPHKIIVAVGGTLSLSPFSSKVVDNSPDPQYVTPSSGKTKYEFISYSISGTMLVEMTNNREIKVEIFPGLSRDDVTNFTANAKSYTR